jgi:hypothetical protein
MAYNQVNVNPYAQGQNDLSFQQFNYGNDYSEYNQTDFQTEIPETVTWESIRRAFSTGQIEGEPPLLQGFISLSSRARNQFHSHQDEISDRV